MRTSIGARPSELNKIDDNSGSKTGSDNKAGKKKEGENICLVLFAYIIFFVNKNGKGNSTF